jgi:hypothetical protein
MLANLTSNQLEFLTTTNQDRRLDVLLEPAGDPTIGLAQVGFETTDACLAEDRIRARAIRALKPKLRAAIPNCDAAGLADRLETIADPSRTKPLPQCLASAGYLRGRRIGVLGAILELVAEHPELDIAWISTTSLALRFDHRENWSEVIGKARKTVQHQMEVSGAMTAPGFLITYLTGYLDQRIGRFRLQFRGIAGGEKLKCIREPNTLTHNAERPQSGLKFTPHRIWDLPRQISGIMPNFLPEVVVSSGNKGTAIQRMSEPYHSIYLIWLSQRALADLWVASGLFYLNGRLAISECYDGKFKRGGPDRRRPAPFRARDLVSRAPELKERTRVFPGI